MTKEESEKNEKLNQSIRSCLHVPVNNGNKIYCIKCNCRFFIVLNPVNRPPISYNIEDDD